MSIAALSNASLILSEEQSPTSDGGQDDEVERHHFGTSTFGGGRKSLQRGPSRISIARVGAESRNSQRRLKVPKKSMMVQLAIYYVHLIPGCRSRLLRRRWMPRLYSPGQSTPPHQIPYIKYQVQVSLLLTEFLAFNSQLGYQVNYFLTLFISFRNFGPPLGTLKVGVEGWPPANSHLKLR